MNHREPNVYVLEIDTRSAITQLSGLTARGDSMPSNPSWSHINRDLLAQVDAEGFHFAVEVGAFEAEGFGGAGDVAVGAVELFEDVVALVGFAGGLKSGELFAAGS